MQRFSLLQIFFFGEVRIMIHIAIVDDEIDYALQVQNYLEQYGKESGEAFNITLFSDGDNIVHKYSSQFDIILMDVEMKFMDGMSAAEEIRKMDSEVVIIFITNMPQYAIRGYAVEALDYLLKPVSYFAFSQCLGRAISRMRNRMSRAVTLVTKNGAARLNVGDIYYVESHGHSMIYHTASGKYECVATMRETEEKLCGMHFFRASKWYLVNLSHVDSVNDEGVRLAGQTLSVSRARKKEFMEALTSYWSEVIK